MENTIKNKMFKKYLWVICFGLLALFMAGCTFSSESGKPGETTENQAEGKTTDEAATGQVKDIMILFTSDVHCGVDEGFGLEGLEQIRSNLQQKGYQVLLVDDGDFLQGGIMGSVTRGQAIVDLMNDMKYDVVTLGNHEFDYGIDQFFNLMKQAEFSVVSCNFNKEGKLVFPSYVIKEVCGRRIAFVGITTPKTLTSSSPKYFQNDQGRFIYGFMEDKSGKKLYDAVQKAVDEARGEGVDYVYVLAHLGNDSSCSPWTYADVISHTNGIDVFLDGHSHDTDQIVMKNKDGKEVVRSACGTKLNSVGYSHISLEEGIKETNIWTWENAKSAPDVFGFQTEIGKDLAEKEEGLEKAVSVSVGETKYDLTINDPVEKSPEGKPIRMARRAETNLGDFCADAYRNQGGTDIGILNGGAVRATIPKGKITYANLINVQPFNNSLCVIEASGQQILDALEWGCRAVPNECGGFLHVSGLTYEIDTRIDSGCIVDESLKCAGIKGKRRVRNVKVGNEPIDPKKKYTVASTDYVLLNQGDGLTAFKDAKVLETGEKQDVQLLTDYIRETLGGVVGDDYADPYGKGRIVFIE